MKIGCIIYAVGDVYEWISECAVKSFKKYHPNIQVHYITSKNINTLKVGKELNTRFKGRHEICRWVAALEIWHKYKYDKIIMLGADTITCAYLSEFIDYNVSDIILTLDEPYQISVDCVPRDPKTGAVVEGGPIRKLNTPFYVFSDLQAGHLQLHTVDIGSPRMTRWISENLKSGDDVHTEHTHCNSDVICFNNPNCLRDLCEFYFRYMKDYKLILQNFENIHNAMGPEGGRKLGDEDLCIVVETDHGPVEIGPCYNEQGALNLLVILSLGRDVAAHSKNAEVYGYEKLLNYSISVACRPFSLPGIPGVLYNVRSYKSNSFLHEETVNHQKGFEVVFEPHASVKAFKVRDNKLYTTDGYQIKVWHYGRALADGSDSKEKFTSFISEYFNDETIDFFKHECDCGEFFENLPVA